MDLKPRLARGSKVGRVRGETAGPLGGWSREVTYGSEGIVDNSVAGKKNNKI